MCFHRKTQFTIHFNLQNDSYWKQMIRVSQAGNYFLFRISVIFFREIFWLIFWKSTLRKLFRGESYKLHTSEPILSEDIKENSPAWPTLQILAFLFADLADCIILFGWTQDCIVLFGWTKSFLLVVSNDFRRQINIHKKFSLL